MNYPSQRIIFDRKKIATKQKAALIQIEVLYRGKKKYFSTGVKVTSDQWDKKIMVKNRSDMLILNDRIMLLDNQIKEYLNSLIRKNEEFSFEKLDAYIRFDNKSNSFLEFMKKRIEDRIVSSSTKLRAMSVYRKLVEFGRIQTFDDITGKNIKLWDDFAKKNCKKTSSVYNYHKNLKTYIREAITLELLDRNPYNSFRLDKGETHDRRYLTPEELKLVENCEIPDPSLSKARDVFVFSCYTGIAPVDLKKFDFTKIDETNGRYRIRDFRQKTGTIYTITLLNKAMDILSKYDFVLPIINNWKYNFYLKSVGILAGVKKPITGYVARHTFATTITLANGVPIEIVSKMLGHKNIHTTQVYAKVLAKNVDDAFDNLERKLK
jgi:site-specific recombinase XerD